MRRDPRRRRVSRPDRCPLRGRDLRHSEIRVGASASGNTCFEVPTMVTGSAADTDTKQETDVAKNPFMSAYLSAANRVANTARGKATNEIKRQSKRQTTSMVNAWVDAWTPKPKAKPARKRKTR